jgi:hypothetical protein
MEHAEDLIKKLKKAPHCVIFSILFHKSPGIDQIPAELIKAGGGTIRCAIHKLIISILNS